MVKDAQDLYGLGKRTQKSFYEMSFGEYAPFEYSLELTRSAVGPIAAYISMEVLGIVGFQEILYKVYSSGILIRDLLSQTKHFEIINMETEGFATLFIAKKPGLNMAYRDVVRLNTEIIDELVDYNHQFFLFLKQQLDEKKLSVALTFSKSYKPFGCKHSTGALKLYQMSPLITEKNQIEIVNQLVEAKQEFDKENIRLLDFLSRPVDFVYRED